jgi:hypothetical protein
MQQVQVIARMGDHRECGTSFEMKSAETTRFEIAVIKHVSEIRARFLVSKSFIWSSL